MYTVYIGLSFLFIAARMAWLAFKRDENFWRRTFNAVILIEAVFAILIWLTPQAWL